MRYHAIAGLKPQPKRKWRRGWDLNPRSSFPDTRFRGELFQPLRHLSAKKYSKAVMVSQLVRFAYVFNQGGEGTSMAVVFSRVPKLEIESRSSPCPPAFREISLLRVLSGCAVPLLRKISA